MLKKKKAAMEPTFCVVSYVVKMTSLVTQGSESLANYKGLGRILVNLGRPRLHKNKKNMCFPGLGPN